MLAIISLLFIISLSLLIMRVGSVALTLTGLSRDTAQFQAQSAFMGVGFTSRESEQVINHPVRRRIIMILMMLGNAGVATAMSSLVLVFIRQASPDQWLMRFVVFVGGSLLMLAAANSRWVNRWLTHAIQWALSHWTELHVQDYENLLHVADGYGVREVSVSKGDWLADQTLFELRLNREGVLVLGIQRPNGEYIGSPTGDTRVTPGDMLILYGRLRLLAELDTRLTGSKGEAAHRAAVNKQLQVIADQEFREEAREQIAG